MCADDVVGREHELRAVRDFLAAARRRPACLVLEGETGVGKSAVWGAAVALARAEGFRVLAARPAATEARLAYACLADLLTGVEDEVLEAIPTPQRQALDVVLLRRAGPGTTDRRAVGAATLSVLQQLAEDGPLVLGVEDLHWVDSSSAGALQFALRRVTGPVGLLGGLRTDEDAGDGSARALATMDTVERVRLGPLGVGALHAMLQARLGRSFPRPLMQRIHDISGGIPFYALELGRALAGGDHGAAAVLPATLADLVRSRVERAPPDVREALLAAALVGEPTVALVRQAVGVGPAEAERLVELGESAGLIRVEGGRIRFAHPLLAAGLSAAAPAAASRAMHRRLAELVHDPEEKARHLALGSLDPKPEIITMLDDAAAHARDRGASAAAAELLELAIRLGADSAERRLRAARHHFDGGDTPRARTMVEQILTELAPGPSRARALVLLATIRLYDDSYPGAAACLQQALGEAGEDLRLRVEISIGLQYVLLNLGRIADASTLAGGTVRTAEALADPHLLALALAGEMIIGFLMGNGIDEGALQRAVSLEDPAAPTPVMLRPKTIRGLLLAWTGHLSEARAELQSVRRDCLDRGEESDLLFTAFHLVILECWRGDVAGARLLTEDTAERAAQLATEVPLAVARFTQATVAAYEGDVALARRAAREAVARFERAGMAAVTVWPTTTLGFADVSVGDYRAATETLGPLVAAVTAAAAGEPTTAPFAPDAVDALVGIGRLADAGALVEWLERNGRRLRRTWALAIGARGRSILRAAQGDLHGALAAAEEALAEHENLPLPFERARTLLALGQIQRRLRHRRAAAVTLQEAAAAYEALGNPLWAARARAELERATAHRAGDDELTSSERRVAQLAATGMTNREVAAELFISPKTVEANLARVYHKLGIRSRAELGRRMADPRA